MVMEDPETNSPPKESIARLSQLMEPCTPNIYPKAHEKATRKDNLNFINSKYGFTLAIAKGKPSIVLTFSVIILYHHSPKDLIKLNSHNFLLSHVLYLLAIPIVISINKSKNCIPNIKDDSNKCNG